MKRLFLLVVVLAALTIFCSAAFAQYGYVIPTLQTVRRDGSTVNVYTYRDVNGNKLRETEYYVNDDGSYGNFDVYYGSQGLAGFTVRTDYKNGVCTMSEQSISYSANGLATVNSRETTFNPDGKVNVLTYTTQELEKDKTVTTGMETDGFGRKIGDFKEERYKDTDNDEVTVRTVYNPDKTVEITATTEKKNGSKIHKESIFDENDREVYSLYIEYDNKEKAVYTEAAKLSYGEGGQVSSENLIVYGPEGKQLRFIEKWNESDTMSTAEGELLDKDGKKLANYSFEKTWFADESEISVETYIYPNGRVDIISKKVDEKGNITINKQLNFKAAGETEEEAAGSELDGFYDWVLIHQPDGFDKIDEETLRYFEQISDIWGENIAEVSDGRDKKINEEPDVVPDNRGEENGAASGEDGEINDVPGEDNAAVSEDNGGNNSEVSDAGGSTDGGSDAGGSDDGSDD